jgi:hypothetical protein
MSGAIGTRWAKLKKQGMIDIVNRLLTLLLPGAPACDDAAAIEEYCPGIFICVNTFGTQVVASPAKLTAALGVEVRS